MVTYVKLENICRTCLANNVPLRSVFEVEIFDEYTVKMVDFIRNLTSIKIARGDGLPENLCVSCVEQMCKTYTFTKLCIASDIKLHLELTHLNSQTSVSCDSKNGISKYDDEIQANEVTVDSDFEVVNEAAMHETTNNDHYQCATCRKTFTNEQFEQHGLLGNCMTFYQCDICLKEFGKKTELSEHIHSHTNDKNFICLQCGQKFAYQYLFEQHKFKHLENKPYPCTKCAKGCLTAESLRRHMTVHDVDKTKKLYVCDKCGKDFPYPSYLVEHAKMHTGEKPFLCSFCGKGFRQNGALAYHIRVHTGFKPHKCQICSSSFTSKSALRAHMRRHTNERPFVCDVCGMAFRQSADMKSHHRIHSGNKRIKCTLCGKSMSTTGQLTVHIRSHTGERPFECDICTKAFTTRTLLVKHRRIHTGEKPYVCNICGRAFNQSSSLKSHGLTHKKNIPKEQTLTLSNSNNREIGYEMDSEIALAVSSI